MKRHLLVLGIVFCTISMFSQENCSLQFALVSDTHIGGTGAEDDLKQTITDINSNDSLAFVIITGDVTEFGSDVELLRAKELLGHLNKPWHVIPGNHDSKWSESGATGFERIFGSSVFSFIHDRFLFIGTSSGPRMRMGPGQVPREEIVWLDSVLNNPESNTLKIVFVNHYPLDDGLNNWYELTDRLHNRNVQLVLSGHGHANRVLNFEGIPGLMVRANMHTSAFPAGYTIIGFYGDSLVTASERRPGNVTMPPWVSLRLTGQNSGNDANNYPRPDYSMNTRFDRVRETWKISEKSDIGSSMTWEGNLILSTNNEGFIKALDTRRCRLRWQFATGSQIYSTPASNGHEVIASGTDGLVYALDLKSGKLLWQFDSHQHVVSSPVIHGNRALITGSGGRAYALNMEDGSVIWTCENIDGFVETIPLVYKGMLIFGTWNNHLYSIDINTGKIIWDWCTGYTNRMLSPAACVPVAVGNRVFVVAPDRKMTCLDALTGTLLWQSDLGGYAVRESMGITADSSLILAKTMDGQIIGVRSDDKEGKVSWKAAASLGYDIAPGVITERDGIIYVPTDKGIVYAIARDDGRLLWSHRISSCLINCIVPVRKNSAVCSSMDGVIVRLKY